MGGAGVQVPKLYVKFQWPLFLALKIRFFPTKSDIFIPKYTNGGGGPGGLGYIPKKKVDAFPYH